MTNTYKTKELAEIAAIEESKMMDSKSITVYFDGMNCEEVGENCSGWDGVSRRCGCGNRRVTWSFMEHHANVWSFYAEAY